VPANNSSNWGTKIGVLTPGTNVTVESELWSMRVEHATMATARIHIDQIAWKTDDDLRKFVQGVTNNIPDTTAQLMQMQPDLLMLGISISPLWDGLKGNDAIKARAKKDTGLDMITPVDAVQQALATLEARRIGVLTPYPQLADDKVVQFFSQFGVEVIAQKGLRCPSAQAIGEVPPDVIAAGFRDVCVDGVDVVAQLGTDLKTAAVAAQAELWLGRPVLAINTTMWWAALRHAGIRTRVPNWGALFERY
jgi:maleate isomerase